MKQIKNFGQYSPIILAILSILICKSLTYPQNSNPVKRRVAQYSSHSINSVTSNLHEIKPEIVSIDTLDIQKWASASVAFFFYQRCVKSSIGSEEECTKLDRRVNLPNIFNSTKSVTADIAVYLAYDKHVTPGWKGKNFRKKVYAVIPDLVSLTNKHNLHDAILVLDPYPLANFGHLIGLFYIDVAVDAINCNNPDTQIHFPDGTCITVAKKTRCPNLLDRFAGTGGISSNFPSKRACHMDLLPSVFSEESLTTPLSQQQQPDLLDCLSLPGFSSCPTFRPSSETSSVLCVGNSSSSNSKRCDSTSVTGTNCRLFQSCDQAVLIGGGWNRLHSPLRSLSNIRTMRESLLNSGFLADNIKAFFANGISQVTPWKVTRRQMRTFSRQMNLPINGLFSSAMKTALRGHIRTICESRHCADTFMLYLNNPTTSEGDMLLWDVDGNGIVDPLERYTVKELLIDLAQCEAKRVVIVADQSNLDGLISALRVSPDHSNVIIYAPNIQDVSTNGQYSFLWTNASSSTKCLKNIHEEINEQAKESFKPTFFEQPGQDVGSKFSIVGAPCDLNPPVSERELKRFYKGCQNIPTSIWFSFNFEDVGKDENGSQEEANNPNLASFKSALTENLSQASSSSEESVEDNYKSGRLRNNQRVL